MKRILALLALALAAVALVLVPVFLIRPFTAQSPAAVTLSYLLRRWSPWFTLVAALAGALVLVRAWRGSRIPARVALVALFLVLGGTAWAARQNHFEWMFAPLPDARFVRAGSADFVGPGDMVLAVSQGGDAAAYPVRQLAYHHLVQDEVGRVPIVATY